MRGRYAKIYRKTTETDIALQLKIDGKGKSTVRTGIPFFDHMLTLFAKHAVVDLNLKCKGDLEVDAHHTVEDCGIALGQAFVEALGDKKGIRRYGAGFGPEDSPDSLKAALQANRRKSARKGEAYVPMDECLARCVVDFGGRPMLVWRGLDGMAFKAVKGDMAMEFRFGLAKEFFQGFANEARCNLHLELLYGEEPHHVSEALFKAFAKAVDAACQRDARIAGRLPSTKGAL
jgi:imidazoleglycerol-phosphate dehydratase